jgi:transcriptional regulator with XRE-family HTH domain
MTDIAELIDALFRAYRKPNGREHTNKEVCLALNGVITPAHLSKLRNGQIKNPGRDTLLALCRFFKVPASYFFPELEPPDIYATEAQGQGDPLAVAMRSAHLSPLVKRKIQDLIQALEQQEAAEPSDE